MVSESEAVVLAELYKLRAVGLGQLVELHRDSVGGERAAYRLVERLAEKGLVRVKVAEWDRRLRYAVLTVDGHALAAQIVGNGFAGEYRSPKQGEVRRLVMAASFYICAVKGGLAEERIISRRDLLERLGMRPADIPCLMWMVKDGEKYWAIHIPWKKKYRSAVERGIVAVPIFKAQYHAIVYDNPVAFGRDRSRYALGAPSSTLHLFTLDLVTTWAARLSRRLGVAEDLGRTLKLAYPGSVILPPPADSPGVCTLRRNRDALVVDMRFNRVGAIPVLARAAQAGFEQRGWGSGVILVFLNLQQLKVWSRYLGDWAWAVVQDDPGAVYRVSGGKPVFVRRGQQFAVKSS